MASWHQFLDSEGVPAARRHVFDYGDGNLTAAEVAQLVATVEARVGPMDVVVAGFFDHGQYDHPDHHAVHQGVVGTAPMVARAGLHGSRAPIDPERWDRLFHRDHGTFQQAYRWLRPPAWPEDGEVIFRRQVFEVRYN